MVYNKQDNMYYGTNAERLALTPGEIPDTGKVYEVDTKAVFIYYNSTWYPM